MSLFGKVSALIAHTEINVSTYRNYSQRPLGKKGMALHIEKLLTAWFDHVRDMREQRGL